MNKYEIVVDTSCDLSVAFLKENNITYVPFSASFDEKTYYKEHIDITTDEFLDKLESGNIFAKTSLPSIGDYTDVFEKILENGNDILCICLSSQLSGSYQSACTAADILKETYPDREIKVIDSLQACASQGLLVLKALEKLENGVPLEYNFNFIEEIKSKIKIYFTVNNLSYLEKGGRLSSASALIGNVLDIKPILSLENGAISPVHKVRKLKKTVQYLVNEAVKARDVSPNGIEVIIINSRLDESLPIFEKELKKHDIPLNYPTSPIGVTISAHIGPGACGILIYTK